MSAEALWFVWWVDVAVTTGAVVWLATLLYQRRKAER